MNIAQHIEHTCTLFPDKTALIFETESFTYRELDELSNRIANSLTGLGISRGDRVALLLPNIPAFVYTYLGIQKLGAIAVCLNSAFKAQEVKFILNDSEAKVVVTTEMLRQNVPDIDVPHLNHIVIAKDSTNKSPAAKEDVHLNDLMAKFSPQATAAEVASNDPAAIIYSSGTTGFPKGATLSHGNVVSNMQMCVDTFGLKPADRIMLFLPAFHCFGQNSALNTCFEVGATLILQRGFDLEQVRQSIVTHRVTVLFGVPTLYLLLYDNTSAEQMRSIRLYISAAANLPLEIAKKWVQKYEVVINDGYGLTEACQICSTPILGYKAGSVGPALDDVEVKIVDRDAQEVLLGKRGEIVVHSPHIMLGYWKRPAETAAVLTDGWFHTGDIGRMDEDGYVYIVDRLKDMVNVGGTKVYPSEVENVIYQHPAVAEVAVYGVYDALLGEQVRASIIPKSGQTVTPEDIIAFCMPQLADFKVPGEVSFVDSLPKSRTGKILKRILREQYQQAPIKQVALLEQLKETPVDNSHSLLTTYLLERVTKVLRLASAHRPKPEHLLSELGFGSLMGIELKNLIATELEIDIPLETFVGKTSIKQLVDILFKELTLTNLIQPETLAFDLGEDLEIIEL